MIIAEWSLSFETRALPEQRLRAIANEMFQGQVGRRYWQSARQARLSTSATGRERRFHEILEEEYQRARPTTRPTTTALAVDHKLTWDRRLFWAGVGAVAIMLGRRLRRERIRSSVRRRRSPSGRG
jgi:hypothetical protein